MARHNTWYLASDQFAFLTFANDLESGRVFHDPDTLELLAGPTLPRDRAVDACFQTYIWHDGKLYSRYPPGFPILLAVTGLVGGEVAQHWLNPALYLTLIVVVGLVAAAFVDRAIASATAVAAMWALLVIPVEVHYWGVTIARDLPAHLLGLAALLVMARGRATLAALLLGFAATIRPDVVLWAIALGVVAPRASIRPARLALASAAFLAAALPLFVYNTITQGHPLAFTQGSEFNQLLALAPTPGLAIASLIPSVSGGAFQIRNLPQTLPINLQYLAYSFGAFAVLAVGMVLHSVIHRRDLGRALGAYAVLGLVFYSCWGHADPRYLVGVSLGLIVLASVATVEVAGWLADPERPWRRRLGALVVLVALLVGSGAVSPRDPMRGLTTLERSLAGALVLATGAGRFTALRRVVPLAPAIVFASFGVGRLVASSAAPGGFHQGDIARAKATIETLIPSGALVLTSPGLGRPAENLTHYTHADAHYLGELVGLGSTTDGVVVRGATRHRPVYFLLAAEERPPLATRPASWTAREIARRDGEAVRDWFIDPNKAAHGAVLYRVEPITLPGESRF